MNNERAWDDAEIRRFLRRESKLAAIGLNDTESTALAERLVYRDRDETDDRKLCLECKNWRGKCLTVRHGYCSIPTILQRCDGFQAVAA